VCRVLHGAAQLIQTRSLDAETHFLRGPAWATSSSMLMVLLSWAKK
jgi:hypothetical protein